MLLGLCFSGSIPEGTSLAVASTATQQLAWCAGEKSVVMADAMKGLLLLSIASCGCDAADANSSCITVDLHDMPQDSQTFEYHQDIAVP